MLNLDRTALVDNRVGRKGGLSEERRERISVCIRQAGGAVRLYAAEIDRVEVLAGMLMGCHAVVAGAAVAERQSDLVARDKLGDVRTDRLDDAASLMAEDSRKRNRNKLMARRVIRVAHAAGSDLDQNLVGLRRSEFNFFYHKRSTRSTGDSCFDFHCATSFRQLDMETAACAAEAVKLLFPNSW